MPSSHLILCCPFLLLPPNPPSIRVFSNESTLHMRWPKYWSFSFSISPSNEHPGLISFRMDWLDLLTVQGTLKSLLQHHSSKAPIFQCSAFFKGTLRCHFSPMMLAQKLHCSWHWSQSHLNYGYDSNWLWCLSNIVFKNCHHIDILKSITVFTCQGFCHILLVTRELLSQINTSED